MITMTKRINVIYATQTGTSYDLAKQFVLANYQNVDVNQFTSISQIQKFSNQFLWIFFISTTGQGDFPYSMRDLWKKMLAKSHPSLDSMSFSIYALGDRSYGDNFCMAARKFRQRLINLGATEVVQIGLGDEQEPNGYLHQYRLSWFPKIQNYLIQNDFLVSKEQSVTLDNVSHQSITSRIGSVAGLYTQNLDLYNMKIVKRQEICSNKDRMVFMIDFQIQGLERNIELGDVISIYPHNNPEEIAWIMKYFGLKDNDLYEFGQVKQKNQQQQQISNRAAITFLQLFKSRLNLSSTLNHSFFISRPDLPDLKNYCSDQLYRQKLSELSNDYDQYHNYVKKYKRNVVEVMRDFELTGFPVEQFILRCSSIVSRKYSVCQIVPHQQKKIVRLLVKLIKENITEIRTRLGLCSHDLCVHAQINQTRKGTVMKGEFNYQEKSSNNMVMISLGTGVAPFVQFFDRALQSKNQWNFILFFTNRYQNEVYFQTQLKDLVAQNKLNPFISFTGEGGKRIIRLVEGDISIIQKLIDECGLQKIKIMVCGPKQVCEGVQNIMARELGLDMKLLRKKKIFLYENW